LFLSTAKAAFASAFGGAWFGSRPASAQTQSTDLPAQGMLLDYAADKVIKKFETSTCDELKPRRASRRRRSRRWRSSSCATMRSAKSLDRQDRRAGPQQDVRMRPGPVTGEQPGAV
jgi:hypothetical protein